jgi:hypothetical protein
VIVAQGFGFFDANRKSFTVNVGERELETSDFCRLDGGCGVSMVRFFRFPC